MASYDLNPNKTPLEPRTTDPVYSNPLPGGRYNVQRVNMIVENGLDQNVSCQAQGRAHFGTIWCNIGSAFTVNKASNGVASADNYEADENWGEYRMQITPAVQPTTGSVAVYAETGFAGALV